VARFSRTHNLVPPTIDSTLKVNTETQKPPLLDRLIGIVSPERALKRAESREMLETFPARQAAYRSQLPTRLDTQWNTTIGYMGANNPLNRWRLTKMRDRARDLERNNAVACAMLDRAVENVIGHGFTLRPQTADEGFNKDAKGLWDSWFKTADIRGLSSATAFQQLMFRCYLRDGDVGAAFVRWQGEAYLQMITGDLIDTKFGGYDFANNILDGIKFDSRGRPLEFHLLTYALDGQRSENIVPARDFVFMSRRRGPDQTRGEPCFAQVSQLMDQIDGYTEATVIAARIAACQGLLIKTSDAGKAFMTLQQQANANNFQQASAPMEPGMIRYIRPGDDVVQVTPQQPTQSFPDFISQLLRFAGVTLGMPLELVMLDFSRTNYSSARASLLQAYRAFRTLQQEFADQFLSRVYRWRISKWVKSGALTVPATIEDSFWSHKWITPGWAWVDPQREIAAAMMEIDAGFNTLTDILAQHGREFEDVVTRRSEEIKRLKEQGVPTAHSGLTRDDVPAGQAAAMRPGTSGAAPAPKPKDGLPKEKDDDNDGQQPDDDDDAETPDSE